METQSTGRGLLFVVDDEPVIRLQVATIALDMGYQVIELPSGMELLDRLSEKPRVVVLDITMPDFDGIETIQGLHAAGFRGWLLLISGYHRAILHNAELLARALKLPLLGTLTKPFSGDELKHMLDIHRT